MTTDRRDGISGYLAYKAPCRVATTANITLSGTQTIDGVAVVADDRVLVKNQTSSAENGVYVVSSGAWTRAPDFDGANDFKTGTQVFVVSGSVGAVSTYYCTPSADPPVIDTSTITFTILTAGGSSYQASDADLTALAALSSTGLVARSASNTYSLRTLTAPAAGITVTYGDGVSGDPTLALANDLAALEGLSGTGVPRRTGTDTWALTAGVTDLAATTANRLYGTNGAGTSSLITIGTGLSLAAGSLSSTVSSPVGKHTVGFGAGGLYPATTNGCAALAQGESSGQKINYKYLAFDASSIEYAWCWIPTPKSYNAGTFTARLTWTHPATTTNFAVMWQVEILSLSDGDSIDTALGTAVTVTDTGGNTGYCYITAETSAITPSNTAAKRDMMAIRISRKASDAADTMAVDAHLIGVEFYYTTDAGEDT